MKMKKSKIMLDHLEANRNFLAGREAVAIKEARAAEERFTKAQEAFNALGQLRQQSRAA